MKVANRTSQKLETEKKEEEKQLPSIDRVLHLGPSNTSHECHKENK